jgi:hypothetical protein
MSFLSLLLGFLSGAANSFSKVLEILKMKKLIEQGRKQKEAEIVAKENELNRQQTEILVQERTKKEVIDKMKDGTF